MLRYHILKKDIFRKLQYVFILYLALLFMFSTNNPAWLTLMQLIFASELFVMFIVLQKAKPIHIPLIVGILLLINAVVARTFFTTNGIHPFGPEPADSLAYMTTGIHSTTLSVEQYIKYVISRDIAFDNFGMIFLARWAAIIGGSEEGYMATLLCFNSIAIIVSSLYIYKAASLILSETTSQVIMVLYGLHQGFIAFSVFGLKENFFMVFILMAFYHLLKYFVERKNADIFFAFLFVLFTCLFRFAVAAQFLLAFLVCLFIGRIGRSWGGALVVVLIVSYIVMINLDRIVIMVGGNGLDELLNTGETGTSNLGVGQRYALNVVYSIIGAPSHIRGEIGFNHITSFSDLLRSLLSVFMIPGVVWTIKKRNIPALFLFVYWILGAGMLALVLRGSDFRFAAMYLPSILLLAGIGYENRRNFQWFGVFSIVMITAILALTLFWNR